MRLDKLLDRMGVKLPHKYICLMALKEGYQTFTDRTKIIREVLFELASLEVDPGKLVMSETEIVESMKLIGSTHIPISKINGKTYYYMCKDDIASAIHAKMMEKMNGL